MRSPLASFAHSSPPEPDPAEIAASLGKQERVALKSALYDWTRSNSTAFDQLYADELVERSGYLDGTGWRVTHIATPLGRAVAAAIRENVNA